MIGSDRELKKKYFPALSKILVTLNNIKVDFRPDDLGLLISMDLIIATWPKGMCPRTSTGIHFDIQSVVHSFCRNFFK
jgi:hypothetical protein